MDINFEWFKQFTMPAATILASIVIGLILQRLVSTRLVKVALKSKWRGDDIIIRGLKGKFVLWAVIIGLYSALPMLHLEAQYSDLTRKILLILVIGSITLAVSSIASGFMRTYTSDLKGRVFSTTMFTIMVRLFIIATGVLIILQALHISITPMLTALGVGGLAVALALQDTLSNLFAGFHIIMTRKVRIGDWIQLSTGEVGQVIDITWRDTTIKQRRNNIIIIPNSTLASSITTNFNLPKRELAIRVNIGVSYGSDLEHVERVAVEVGEEVMKTVDGAVPTHKPFVRYESFGDSSIDFYVNLRMKSYDKQFRIVHEYIKRIHKRFNEEGIVIPFPIRTLDIPGNVTIEKKD